MKTFRATSLDEEYLLNRVRLITGEPYLEYQGTGVMPGGLEVRCEQPLWDVVVGVDWQNNAEVHSRRHLWKNVDAQRVYGFRRPGGVKILRNWMEKNKALEMASRCVDNLEWNIGRVRDGEIPAKNIRYAQGGTLNPERSEWEGELHATVNDLSREHDKRCIEATVNVMYYPKGKGGHYVEHLDNSHDYFPKHPDIVARSTSVILALRKAPKGGEIESCRLLGENNEILRRWDPEHEKRDSAPTIVLEPGDALMFPSMETYHKILPTTKGSRLSAVSWHPVIPH